MTRKDKIGVVILIGLFIIFGIALALTTKPFGESHDPQDSFFVQQRIRNLEKSQ